MDINEDRRTELLWRRIVDLRSQEACLPLDENSPTVDTVEMSELQRLAEDTGDALGAEITRGQAAARSRLIQFIQSNPVSPKPHKSMKWGRRGRRLNERTMLVMAILLLAAAIALAARSWIDSQAAGQCGTTAVQPAKKKASAPASTSQSFALLKSAASNTNTDSCLKTHSDL